MKALKYTFGKTRSSYYELTIASDIHNLVDFYEMQTLESFSRELNAEISKIPRRSVGYASNYYEVVLMEDPSRVEVWHLTSRGDRDRLLAKIEYITKP